MKTRRILVAFAAIALLSGSCSSGDDYTGDPIMETCQDWYRLASLQNDMALDPFNVAYRLNTYIQGVTFNQEDEENLRNTLFAGVEISKSGFVYTLKFNTQYSKPNDMVRGGWLIFDTKGESLSDADTEWTVVTEESHPYVVVTGIGTVEQSIGSDSYTINTLTANKWRVTGSYIYNTAYSLAASGYWSIGFDIEQTSGNQTFGSLQGDVLNFSVSTNPDAVTGGKNLNGTHFRYSTPARVLYSTTCPYNRKAGGTEKIVVMDSQGLVGKDTVTYAMGEDLDCWPVYNVTAKIDGKEYTARFE